MKNKTVMNLTMTAWMMAMSASALAVQAESVSEETYAVEEVSEEATEDMSEEEIEHESAVTNVVLADYTSFTYVRTVAEVTDDEVESQIEQTLESYTPEVTYEESGTVEEGDAIKLSISGTLDGVEEDSLTIEEAEVVVGGGELMDELDSQLAGLTVGEETELTIVFPEDYWSEEVAGKTAVLQVTILGIGEVQEAPELTDEWAAENTAASTAEEYRELVRSELEEMAEEEADYDAMSTLVSQLVDTATVSYDEDMLDAMVQDEITQTQEEAEEEDMTYEEYLEEYLGSDEDSYEEEVRENLLESEKRSAVLNAFAEEQEIDLSDEAYEAYLESIALSYGYESGEAYREAMAEWGFEEYVREGFEEAQVGAVLLTFAQEVEEEDISEDMDDEEDWDEWVYDEDETDDREEWEYESEDWEEWDDLEWEYDTEDEE